MLASGDFHSKPISRAPIRASAQEAHAPEESRMREVPAHGVDGNRRLP